MNSFQNLLATVEAISVSRACKSSGRLWQPRQTLSRLWAQLLCSSWRLVQRSRCIGKLCTHKVVCHEAKKKVRLVRDAGRKTYQSACLTRHCLAAYSGTLAAAASFFTVTMPFQYPCSRPLQVLRPSYIPRTQVQVHQCRQTGARLVSVGRWVDKVRELWLSGHRELGLSVGLIVELESVVAVSKVLLGLLVRSLLAIQASNLVHSF